MVLEIINEGVEVGEVGGGEGVGEDEVVVGVKEGKGLGALIGGEGRVQFYGFLGVVILRLDDQVEEAQLNSFAVSSLEWTSATDDTHFRGLMWGIGVGVSRAC